jgi:hypothetical protein
LEDLRVIIGFCICSVVIYLGIVKPVVLVTFRGKTLVGNLARANVSDWCLNQPMQVVLLREGVVGVECLFLNVGVILGWEFPVVLPKLIKVQHLFIINTLK